MKVVDFTTYKDAGGRNEMLGLLAAITERVRSGEVTGLVILQTTDSQITYNSAAGRCITHNMLGLMYGTAVQIADIINNQAEDIEA